jgi:hypothetical protein
VSRTPAAQLASLKVACPSWTIDRIDGPDWQGYLARRGVPGAPDEVFITEPSAGAGPAIQASAPPGRRLPFVVLASLPASGEPQGSRSPHWSGRREMASSIRPVSRALNDHDFVPLTCKDSVSEGGLEPFAYAQVLSAEFTIEGRS